MKVDRRSFLGLGLGAVAGVAISPVGAKLTDDSSIWTQNWPWTPVPADGEITYDNSVCSLCPGNCGISVRKIDGRPVKIEGLNDYPVNNGGACLHGIAGLQYLYDPARVKTPLKKNGNRFQKISWDEAITLVAGKLAELRKQGSPEKLACITGKDQGSVVALYKHFLAAFGSANHYAMPSLETWLALTAEQFHGPDTTLGFDLENSDYILSFGAGFIEGWGVPVACFKANAGRKERHARLVQVEPRLSNTAASADKWLPANPGTEADLALCLCNVIIEKQLFDPGFAAGFKGGFNKFAALLKKDYSLSRIAALTGLKAADIESTAVAFAKAKMPVAIPGKGRGAGAQSLKEFAAVHALNLLKGTVNKKGGVFVKPFATYLSMPDPVQDETAEKGAAAVKLAANVDDLISKINRSDKPVVDALLVYDANPCYTLNDPKQARAAFEKVPFVVSISSFLDETAMAADVVLPASTFLERYEDVPCEGGAAKTVVGLSRPVLKPLFDTKSPGETVIQLAKALEGTVAESFEWESYEDCLENIAGDVWEDLSGNGYAVLADKAPQGVPGVNFSFLSAGPQTVQPQGEFELTLIPIDNMRLFGAVPAASPFAVKTVSDRVISGSDILVDVNPKTADELKLKADGYATLTTPNGSAKVKVNLNEGIMPGVIGMAKGLGHTFDNKYVAGKGVNVNDLIGPVIEPGSGLDAARAVKAKITKA